VSGNGAREAEAAVIGGGPAGAAAAARLAEAGCRVVLYERMRAAHHKVCGEFLSGEAARLMAPLGLSPEALGGVPIGRVRMACGRRDAMVALPFPAWSLGRDVLDEALLAAASARGAELRRGAAVRGLEVGPDGTALVEVAPDREGRGRLAAGAVVLATGKHDLRGHRRPPAKASDPIGFKQHWRLPGPGRRALAGTVELHLFEGGYAGLQEVPGGRANLCMVVERDVFARLGRDWGALLGHATAGSALLAERLRGAEPCWPRPLSVYAIPYGFVHRAAPGTGAEAGPHRVGDQLAVIPSFCGDGVAIALDSGRRAAGSVLDGRPPADGAPYAAQIAAAGAAARIARSPAAPLAVLAARLMPGLVRGLALRTRVA
jgi:menaquinone-9 beta-reductase